MLFACLDQTPALCYFPLKCKMTATFILKLSSTTLLILLSCGCCNRSPQTRELKQEKCILSQLWEPEVRSQGVGWAVLPAETPGENPLLLLPASDIPRLMAPPYYQPLPSSSRDLCVPQSSLGLFLRKTFVIGFRAHLGNCEAISVSLS